MNAKIVRLKAKRKASARARRLFTRALFVRRRRVKKAEYWLEKGAYKEFKKGGSKHDVFFHLMLKDVAFVARFLDAYLPEKLRNALDLSDPNKIRTLSTDFYDRRGKKHIADLIFVVPCKEENEFVTLTLIVEHKAQSGRTIDRKTIAQLLKYVALEVEILLQGKRKIIYQPLVVLFYTGPDPNFDALAWEKFFPLPKLLQVEELRGNQIRFEPVCINLTRLFLEDKLSEEDFLRVMVEAMARASLKCLKGSYSTLFRALGRLRNLTDEDRERLDACVNYVASVAEEPMSEEELEALQQSVNNEEVGESMKTILDKLVDKGRDEGWNNGRSMGEIKAIQTVVRFRFSETSVRLSQLLSRLNDLQLLNQTYDFALNADSLSEIEDFVENLIRSKRR